MMRRVIFWLVVLLLMPVGFEALVHLTGG